MANHSLIWLKNLVVTPGVVEDHAKGIVDRRFKGKVEILPSDLLTKQNLAERAWIFSLPNTRPKKPGPMFPDEDLGFCFWLNEGDEGGQTLELRHVVLQPWVAWAQSLFTHALAESFGVKRFDGGDGTVKTDPGKYKDSARAYYMRDFIEPLKPIDREFLERQIFRHIPEGWE